MSQEIKAAHVDDFKTKKFKCIRFMTKTIAIFKENDHNFYAIEADCKHQNANILARGLKGDIAVCPRHGWEYNIKTGECLTHKWAKLRKHEVSIKDKEIYVKTTPSEAMSEEDDDDFFSL